MADDKPKVERSGDRRKAPDPKYSGDERRKEERRKGESSDDR